MLKLLVADDERILREAVCYLIDWKSIGIELAASSMPMLFQSMR